jgi:SAM-dependent methyltransferase
MSLTTRGRRDGFWTDRKVVWYRRANDRSDYAERVIEAIAYLLDGTRSVLDVGAGFGALALPFARRVDRVTAFEPAPGMAEGLRAAAAEEGLRNIEVIEAAWGETPVAPHDLVVCAHVGPLLGSGARFLEELPRIARRGVVLVRDAPAEDDDKFYFKQLYPLLLGREYGRSSDHAETVEALGALGVQPTTTFIRYSSDQPFASLEEACDFWMEYMGLEGREAPDGGDVRAFLRTFLANRLRREGDGVIAPFRKRAAVIHWRVSPGGPEA